jgi:hypothetical protein
MSPTAEYADTTVVYNTTPGFSILLLPLCSGTKLNMKANFETSVSLCRLKC